MIIECYSVDIKIYQMQGKNSQICYSQSLENIKRHEQMEETGSVNVSRKHPSLGGKKIKVDLKQQQNLNRLPINLCHSAAEYNKMLITNGKSLQQTSQPQIDGFLDSLEFINESIYESNEQRRETRKREIQWSASKVKKNRIVNDQCCCCCCDNYCLICAKESTKRNIISHQHIVKSSLVFPPRKPKNKEKRLKNKSKTQKQVLKQYNSSNRGKWEKDLGRNSYLSHKKFNIDRLICQSLIRFEEEKREKRLKKVMKEKTQMDRKGMLKHLNEKIRSQNKQSLSKNKSENN